ncbi:MAG: hypothetical protein P4L92_02815 [Rudaea sp.]|nr:hypothetical protein [Rudaea sp.]
MSDTPGHCLLGNQRKNGHAKILGIAAASGFILGNSFESFELPYAGPSPRSFELRRDFPLTSAATLVSLETIAEDIVALDIAPYTRQPVA